MSATMDVPSVPDTTPAEPTPDASASPAPSWQQNFLDPDLRQEPTLGRFKSVGDLAKSYLEARSKISAKGVIPPGPDADPKAWDEVYNALGRPESPEKYDFGDWKPPAENWDPALQSEAVAQMHAAGLSSKQAAAVLKWYAERSQQEVGSLSQRQEQLQKQWNEEISKRWGGAVEQKLDLAERAFKSYFPESIREQIASARLPDGGALGDHPAFLEAMATIGERMAEHQLLGDKEPTRFAHTPDEAKRDIQKMIYDKNFREELTNTRHPNHENAKARWEKAHRDAEGGDRPATNVIVG